MKDNNKAIELMVDANIDLIKRGIDLAAINRTVYGRIVELLGNDEYRVIINDREYTVKSHWKHEVNDIVVIIRCNNNWKNLYVLY